MKPKSLLPALLALLLSFLYLASSALPARADTKFNVNSTADAVDANPGNGACATAGGDCTLRAAIQEANALPGHDTILLPSGTYSLTIAGRDEDASATGDLDVTDHLTLIGERAGDTILTASSLADRNFHIVPASIRVHLSNLTIRDGTRPHSAEDGQGGGIFNAGLLTADTIIIRDNYALFKGGGIYNAGVLTLTNSTLTLNTASGTEDNESGLGGGIYNTGTFSVTNTTISGNSASGGDGGSGHGGGIYNEGSLWLVNTTIYRNGAAGWWSGGSGAGLQNAGNVVMKHSLLAGNVVSYRRGEFIDDCSSWTSLVSEGYNLIEGARSNSCVFTDETPTHIEGVPPNLGGLTDNGGPTPTHAPKPGSPAIDWGDPAGCTDVTGAPLLVDQRGLPRPADGDENGDARCDIGAVEAEGYVPPPPVPPSIAYENVEPVGDAGGQTYAVAVQGRYAYSGMGWRMVVVDVLDPANPTIVGTSDFFPRGVQGITVAGNYAYVAAGGLYIVDVSDPTNPVTVGSYTVPGRAMDVALDGQYAYVAAGDGGGLQIIDVSDPAVPTKVGHYHTASVALSVAVSGTHAFVADQEAGIYVLDVADPSNPSRVAFLTDYEGSVKDVVIAGDYAYVAEDSYWAVDSFVLVGGGLRVLNVSNPEAPEAVAFYDTKASDGSEGGAHALAIAGSSVYVADRGNGLYVIDVSAPSDPQQVGSVQDLAAANDVALAGEYAYVAGETYFSIVDVSSPSAPATLERIAMSFYWLGALDVQDGRAYVAGVNGGGLGIWDVSNPALPRQMSVYEIPGEIYEVVVSDTYAYVVQGPDAPGGGLHILNVQDSTNPELAGFYDTPGTALGLAVVGDRAYVADAAEGLHILDISDPSEPSLLGTFPTVALRVEVVGTYAYIGAQNGLYIVDVSNPATPEQVGFYAMLAPTSIAVAGDHVYLTESRVWTDEQRVGGGLRILDVSDPTTPGEVAYYEAVENARDVAIRGQYAYVVDVGKGLRVLDVSNPSTPSEVGFLQTTDETRRVALDENYIYTTHSAFGLLVQSFTPSAPNALRLDSFGAPPSSPSYLGLAALLLAPVAGLILVRRRRQHL